MQYAKITEEITVDGTTKTLTSCISAGSSTPFLFLTKDGSLSTSTANAYRLQETDDSCSQLPVIPDIDILDNVGHKKDACILIWICEVAGVPQMYMVGVPW